MTDEKIMFAIDLKQRIDKIDREIENIMEIKPPVRTECNFFRKTGRGFIKKIKNGRLITKELLDIDIELSSEDCRALIDIRTAEREALQQVLNNLK
ncbi:hypothetical protein [Eisenbergiella tayi]|uniref:hypothetical protein n=1 Tax=Eisenbergiella tayi TaxID=1432052 RepID=UPI00307BFD0B